MAKVDEKVQSEHVCKHPACKCKSNDAYCGVFCNNVEETETSIGCGCGHVACDSNPELGNEETFRSGA